MMTIRLLIVISIFLITDKTHIKGFETNPSVRNLSISTQDERPDSVRGECCAKRSVSNHFRSVINFWEWELACQKICAGKNSTQKSPLTKAMLLNQVAAYCNAQANTNLADKNKWVNTSFLGLFNTAMPNPEFFQGKVFEPFVQKITVGPDAATAFHGDLHGDILSLNAFIKSLWQQGYMDQQNPFKIVDPNFTIVFLGDYTDRGDWGAEVIYTILELWLQNPEQVILVRGNHEDLLVNNYYGFSSELNNKFGEYLMPQISKIYNYMPVALFVQSGSDAFLCCHGGLEFGFEHAHALLNATGSNRYVLIHALSREKRVHSFSPEYRNSFTGGSCNNVISPRPANIGFMWNDFEFCNKGKQTQFVHYQEGRGWEFPEYFTKYLLSLDSTPSCAIRGVFRAHQHNDRTLPRILNHDNVSDPEDAGVAKLWLPIGAKQPAGKLWDGIVCTFCVSPNTPYGMIGNYNFDSFGILKTAEKFEDWHLDMHRIITKQ